MDSVIKILFEDILSKSVTSQEYKDCCRKEEELWDKLRPLLSEKQIEELCNAQSDTEQQANMEWFREGIRIGITLMMELL